MDIKEKLQKDISHLKALIAKIEAGMDQIPEHLKENQATALKLLKDEMEALEGQLLSL